MPPNLCRATALLALFPVLLTAHDGWQGLVLGAATAWMLLAQAAVLALLSRLSTPHGLALTLSALTALGLTAWPLQAYCPTGGDAAAAVIALVLANASWLGSLQHALATQRWREPAILLVLLGSAPISVGLAWQMLAVVDAPPGVLALAQQPAALFLALGLALALINAGRPRRLDEASA